MNPPIPALSNDFLFDQHLPSYVRFRSRQYWTPVAVAARVAAIFRTLGARRILDVGSGPGKFCVVAGCTCPELEWCGVEQRPRLVRIATRLARHFAAGNVRFDATDATQVAWSDYQGFYFFNPFAENVFHGRARFDDEPHLSMEHFGAELLLVGALLAQARIGTIVVTFHGLGGPIPSSYELIASDDIGVGRIRTWVQRSQRQTRWAWLEDGEGVVRVLHSDVRRTLASRADGRAGERRGHVSQQQATMAPGCCLLKE